MRPIIECLSVQLITFRENSQCPIGPSHCSVYLRPTRVQIRRCIIDALGEIVINGHVRHLDRKGNYQNWCTETLISIDRCWSAVPTGTHPSIFCHDSPVIYQDALYLQRCPHSISTYHTYCWARRESYFSKEKMITSYNFYSLFCSNYTSALPPISVKVILASADPKILVSGKTC